MVTSYWCSVLGVFLLLCLWLSGFRVDVEARYRLQNMLCATACDKKYGCSSTPKFLTWRDRARGRAATLKTFRARDADPECACAVSEHLSIRCVQFDLKLGRHSHRSASDHNDAQPRRSNAPRAEALPSRSGHIDQSATSKLAEQSPDNGMFAIKRKARINTRTPHRRITHGTGDVWFGSVR